MERGYGKACEKKLLAAKERYRPTALFDVAEYPIRRNKATCEPAEPAQAARVRMAIQVPMNFTPVIDRELSMIEQYRAVMRVLNKKEN